MTLSVLRDAAYALAPEIVLTAKGPQKDHVLAIKDGKITEVLPAAAYAAKYPGTKATPLPGKAVIPGFIDAHTHAGQTFGKAAIGGEPSQIWMRIWAPLEDALDPERAYVAAKWMFLESLRGGFTGIVNYALNPHDKNEGVLRAAKDTGIRLVSATGLATMPGEGPTDPTYQDIVDHLEEHIAACAPYPNVTPSLCSTGHYSKSVEITARLAEYCAKKGVLFQMHSNEHFPEVHHCILTHGGKRPIELWSSLGVLGPTTLLHHTTIVTDREIEMLAKSKTGISYNPVASQWKGNAVAPALSFVERGVRMGVGTDATRSDAFRMIDAAENCQRIAHSLRVIDFSCGAGWTWVDAATRGSADVCGLGKTTGTLTAGLAADFLVLDMRAPEVVPAIDFEWELVRLYNRDQVDAVVVAGKLVMEGGKPAFWDQDRFVADNAALAAKTLEEAKIVRLHGPSGNYRPG